MPMVARSASVVFGNPCINEVMGRASASSVRRAASLLCRAASAAFWAATCAGNAALHTLRASLSGFNSVSSNPCTLQNFSTAA